MGRAETQSLESPLLRLEIATSPYAFRVIEKSTGDVLLSQDNTAFTFGGEFYPVAEAANVKQGSSALKADLLIELAGRDRLPNGSPAKAQVSFTFVSPEILQIHITYAGGTPSEISEEFNDQGEHYYGIWEYPTVDTSTIAERMPTSSAWVTHVTSTMQVQGRPSM
jgi:hypothetical protein